MQNNKMAALQIFSLDFGSIAIIPNEPWELGM
jgi:hypothetical protein